MEYLLFIAFFCVGYLVNELFTPTTFKKTNEEIAYLKGYTKAMEDATKIINEEIKKGTNHE